MPEGDWFADLNLVPTHRVVAGLGTRVVNKDQEQLMQSAWAQVGEVDKANRALALAEFARNLAQSIHARLADVEAGRLLQMTRPLATRVRVDGDALTVAGQTARSAVPSAALGGSFRRTVRATGPMARRLSVDERETAASLVTDRDGAVRDFTRPYTRPDGIGGLSAFALESFDTAGLAQAFDTSPEEAHAKVTQAAELLAGSETLASALSNPSSWRAADETYRPGARVAERVVARIQERLPADPGVDIVKSRWLGGLTAGLATTQVDGTAGLHDVTLRLEEAVRTVGVQSVQEVGEGRFDVRSAGVDVGGVDVASETARPTGDLMLRGVAARGAGVAAVQAEPVDRTSFISIQRPVFGGEREDGVEITERERLDQFRTVEGTQLATWLEQAQRVTVTDVRSQLSTLVDMSGALTLAPTPPRDALAVTKDDLLRRLDPTRTVIDTMRARLNTGLLGFDAVRRRADPADHGGAALRPGDVPGPRQLRPRVAGARTRHAARARAGHRALDERRVHRGVPRRAQRRDGPRAALARVPDRQPRHLLLPLLGPHPGRARPGHPPVLTRAPRAATSSSVPRRSPVAPSS